MTALPGAGSPHQGMWGHLVWQGLTLQVENPRKGKLDMQGIDSSAVFLQLVGKLSVSTARKAEPILGTAMGAGFPAQML